MASSDFDGRDAVRHFAAHSPKAARAMRVLERLAESLAVPVERFFAEAVPDATPPAAMAAEAEAAELSRLYLAIDDAVLRRRCLAFVRAAATRPRGLSRSRRGRS